VEIVDSCSCGICGCKKLSADENWFLLCESRWQDRLKILRWNEQLAMHQSVYCACSAAHVQELVIHWMITGGLDYPFAVTTSNSSDTRTGSTATDHNFYLSAAEQIGELSVHRESIQRVLAESPQSLTVILEALHAALDSQRRPPESELEAESDALCLVGEEI